MNEEETKEFAKNIMKSAEPKSDQLESCVGESVEIIAILNRVLAIVSLIIKNIYYVS